MFATILAAVLAAQPPMLDGLERAVIVSEARDYGFERRDMDDAERRVWVESRLRWNAPPLSAVDERWLDQVVDWACKPYDKPPTK